MLAEIATMAGGKLEQIGKYARTKEREREGKCWRGGHRIVENSRTRNPPFSLRAELKINATTHLLASLSL